ncbi:hypothetical protein [Vibrio diabolicus]|uniref:hypothetical protein n=1 Tax=Vibrio diabolicus TaxID=50719 RepID=UPI0015F75B68|nr:hypothetical protein [Vibrio diabolicus]
MKQPYENIYIGNFIFSLGYYSASTGDGLSNKAVQLVQQTPDEKKLNDLFVNWAGKNYIFEFKRNPDSIKTELYKEPKMKLNKALNHISNLEMKEIANKGHFLGFGLTNGIGFICYSDADKPLERYYPLDKFCPALLKGNLGQTYDEFCRYLRFIEQSTQSKSDVCGGFVLNISKDGDLNMLPFDNIELLSKSLDVKVEPPRPTPPTPSPYGGFSPGGW